MSRIATFPGTIVKFEIFSVKLCCAGEATAEGTWADVPSFPSCRITSVDRELGTLTGVLALPDEPNIHGQHLTRAAVRGAYRSLCADARAVAITLGETPLPDARIVGALFERSVLSVRIGGLGADTLDLIERSKTPPGLCAFAKTWFQPSTQTKG